MHCMYCITFRTEITLFIGAAETDAILDLLNTAVSADSSDDLESLYTAESRETIEEKLQRFPQYLLCAYAASFDRGLISCQRLVDVSFVPYLKLASANASRALGQGTRDRLLVGWFTDLGHILNLATFCDNGGGIVRDVRLLRPQKRVQLVKALLRAKVPEVCGVWGPLDFL